VNSMMRRTKRKGKPPDEPAPDATIASEDKPALDVRVLRRESGEIPYLDWFRSLRDAGAKTRVAARIARLRLTGNFGDHRERISGAVSELRIDYGPGYRVYYVQNGNTLILLIVGGVKDGQQSDIQKAVALWEECKDDNDRFSGDFVS